MTKIAKAVIGAGYGDEGKGLMTDYLAADHPGAVIVRTNGGAQAGHTVVTPEGIRHVFHHVGSGALAGAETHLSRFFVAHPMFFLNEIEVLAKLGANTKVSIDPRALITTPYDIMINQIIESRRANGRHGSCGMGFGETIERSNERLFEITAGDLKRNIRPLLDRIRKQWVLRRLEKLGASNLTDEELAPVQNDDILERFAQDCESFLELVTLRSDETLGAEDVVIFEGAQGLMLDQDYGAFPHVTRSNTGMPNIAAVCGEAGIKDIDIHYMTRAYTTRHGAGPLRNETESLCGVEVVDPTNATNEWQGALRLAPLDVDGIVNAIKHDLSRVVGELEIRPGIIVTCMDQIIGDTAPVEVAGKVFDEEKSYLLGDFGAEWAPHILWGASYGPTRDDVVVKMPTHTETAKEWLYQFRESGL